MGADLLPVLARTALVSGAAIVLVLLLRRPLRSVFGAQVAYAAWGLVPSAMLAAWLPASPLAARLGVAMSAEVLAAMPLMAGPANVGSSGNAAPGLLLLWSIGVAAMLAALLRRQRRYVGSLGPLSPGDGEGFLSERPDCGPVLIGALRPRLVLPADFHTRYTRTERDLVLAHERVHLQRGDTLVNAGVALLRCLFWFNPLVHVAAARFRFDQELACDAAVLTSFPQARRAYADAMLKTQLADPGLPVGCHPRTAGRLPLAVQPSFRGESRHAETPLARYRASPCQRAVYRARHRRRRHRSVGRAARRDRATAIERSRERTPCHRDVPGPVGNHAVRGHRPKRQSSRLSAGGPRSQAAGHRDPAGARGDPRGESREVIVETSSDAETLDAAAVAAARQWKFNPGITDGKPSEGAILVPVTFSLNAGGGGTAQPRG